MDPKDWNDDDPEFWDTEEHEDDEDDYNGLDENVDAKNDETFDNAAEWNEDEHEELIAQDMILSHSGVRKGGRNNTSNNNSNNHQSQNDDRHNNVRIEKNIDHGKSRNLIDFRNLANNTNSSRQDTQPKHYAMFAHHVEPSRGCHNSSWSSSPQAKNAANLMSLDRDKPGSSTSGNANAWQDALSATQRSQMLQLQQQAQEQLRLLSLTRQLQEQEQERLKASQSNELRKLLQQRQQDQQHQLQMQQHQRNLQAQHIGTNAAYIQSEFFNEKLIGPKPPISQPQVMTVDELERQLMKTSIDQSSPLQVPTVPRMPLEASRRAGWSPFGSKDLFKTDDPAANIPVNLLDPNLFRTFQPQSMSLEQQKQLLLQQQLLLQHQQLQQLALQNQQQQLQQQILQQKHKQEQQQNHQSESRLAPPNAKCFTVEELERQMLADRSGSLSQQDTDMKVKTDNSNNSSETIAQHTNEVARVRQSEVLRERNVAHDRRNGEKHDRYARHNRDMTENRVHHKDRRDHRNHRDDYRERKEEPTIVPPQCQLSVIDKAKLRHSITAMHSDEIIRDRMPSAGEGFRYLRHSEVLASKGRHDGVLTDKERDWLTRIQEKIQADYDNSLDQDYYYLLYFNRSSMTDEAAQKPSGPGVLDRRFIPRERLLYNSGV